MDTGEERVPGRDRSPRGRSASSLSSTGLSGARSPSARGRRERGRSLPARPASVPRGVDPRQWTATTGAGHQPPVGAVPSFGPQFYQMGTPPQTAPQEPLQVPNMQLPVAPGVAQQMEFTRAMLQAQDEQIRQQAAQLQQMSAMLTQALQLASANAANAHIAAAAASSSTSPTPGGDPSAAPANASTPVDMEVDSGVRNKRAEGYIPQLPQLNYASMTSRHAEIRVWTAYRDELTSWLCLLDDRYATELQEAISSNVEVLQVRLQAGKAARSTKLWFLLRQSMSKFQRGQDLVHLIEVKQMGASAGYELWRSLNNELSVRSRVEGQALREQALGLVPPKHLKRPLDVARWYTTELLKFEAQVKHRFPELLIGEQEGVLCLMKHLDSETKRYLLLHHSTKSMGELMTGLQFYDEQLRVMDFQREGASGYANAFKGGRGGKGDRDKSNKGPKGNKGNKGEKGEKGQKGGKAKGKDKKGDQGGKGDRARSKSREAKKTDVCRNCGKTGHWARDCWAPPKDKAAAATSQAVTTQPEAPSSSSSTSAKAAAQPTTKGSGKAQSSIKTFLEGYHFGMMLTNQVVSFPSDDRVYWLIDSGSSFHIITRETLESNHVKILSWLEGRPKSYAETATGDSVEIGGSTHVLVEVCFETTTPASSKSSSEHEGDAVYLCRARFEAVISDQIKHNLLNINLLCQNGGWEPAMCDQQGVITVRKHGVTLRPTMFASVSWLASVRNDHPLALKPQDLIAKTEQFRRSRSRKSSSSRDFHRSTSNRGHRSSARVCVEPENPELLDVSCLDEVVDCEFQTSHEHVDLDQGEAKDRLRTVGDVSGSGRDQLQFFSHVDTPVVRKLDRDERLIFSEDNSVISHKQQDDSTTPAVERLVFENDSSVISHKQQDDSTTPAVERLVFENDSSVISHKQQDNSTTPAVERLAHEHGRETVVCRACLEDFPDEVETGSLDCSKRRSFPRAGQIGDRRYGSECHDATEHSTIGRHAPGGETQETDIVGGLRHAARHRAATGGPRGTPGVVCRGGLHWRGRDGSGPGFGKAGPFDLISFGRVRHGRDGSGGSTVVPHRGEGIPNGSFDVRGSSQETRYGADEADAEDQIQGENHGRETGAELAAGPCGSIDHGSRSSGALRPPAGIVSASTERKTALGVGGLDDVGCASVRRSLDGTSFGSQRLTGYAGDAVLSPVPEICHRSPLDERATRSQHAGLHADHLQGGPPRDAEPGGLDHMGASACRARAAGDWSNGGQGSVSGYAGTDRHFGRVSSAEPEGNNRGSTGELRVRTIDNGGGGRRIRRGLGRMEANHRGSSSNDPSTSGASPYLHDAAAGGTGRPTAVYTEHRRGPEPRHAKSSLRVTPPWRESLSNLGFHGPYLQLHLSTPGHTSEGLTSPRTFEGELPADASEGPCPTAGQLDTFESRQRPVRQCDEGGRDNGNRSIGNSGTGRKAIQPNEPSHAARDRDPHGPSIRRPAPSKIGEHTGCEGGRQAKVGAPDPSSTSGSATRAHSRDTNSVEWRTLSCIHGTHQAPPRSPRARSFSLPVSLKGSTEKPNPILAALSQDERKEPDTRQPQQQFELVIEEGIIGDNVRSKHAELQHHMQGHVPYMSDCEFCQRTRGTTPARKRSDLNPREFQLDQCFFRKLAFIVLVHTMSFAIAVCFRPEGESAATTAEHLHPWVRHFGVKQPHFMSDAEGLTKNIAARLADLCEGTEDSFAPERHAPAAERAIRTLKGIVATHELELREHGVVLDAECADVFDLLFQYAAHTHNRFSVSVGSTMTPMQKIRGDRVRPQVTYPFGAVAYAKITRARRPDADAKYARGIYLGPVLGSTGHAMEIRLDSGETKRVIAPGLKLLYPLRFDANLLPGAKALDGFVPPPEAPKTKELFLPYVPGGGPPIDWVRQHGVTPKCPGCQEGVSSSRHSQKCVKRYQKWLRDSIDDALEALDEGPKVDRRPEELIGEDPYDDDEQMKPNKRTRFGGEEVRAFDPEQAGVGDLEIPEISAPDADWNVSEYQPSEAEDEDMGDALEHPQTFHEGVPVRYLEELLENAHYTPQPLSCCDHYDVEAACHLLVGRSSVEKFPYVCLNTTTQRQHHKQQQSVEREAVELLNLQDHPCVCSSVKEKKGR